MNTFTITRGLPGSGKSTWAIGQVESDANTKRVNRDDLRFEMFRRYVGLGNHREKEVTERQQSLVRAHLQHGFNVIVDDTNLNNGTVSSWRKIAEEFDGGTQFGVQDFPTDVDECIRRDQARKDRGERATGPRVIKDMSERYMRGTSRLPRLPQAITRPIPVPPSPKDRPHAIIFDIDGTLCDVRTVRHHVIRDENGRRDFHAFHMESLYCPPNLQVVAILTQAHDAGLKVVIVTAREQKYQDLTEKWLEINKLSYDAIYARPLSDRRVDYDVKCEILQQLSKHFNVVHAVDDNPNVLKLWKEQKIRTTIVPGYDDEWTNQQGTIPVTNPLTDGRCIRCGRKLTTGGPLGPECAKVVAYR